MGVRIRTYKHKSAHCRRQCHTSLAGIARIPESCDGSGNIQRGKLYRLLLINKIAVNRQRCQSVASSGIHHSTALA